MVHFLLFTTRGVHLVRIREIRERKSESEKRRRKEEEETLADTCSYSQLLPLQHSHLISGRRQQPRHLVKTRSASMSMPMFMSIPVTHHHHHHRTATKTTQKPQQQTGRLDHTTPHQQTSDSRLHILVPHRLLVRLPLTKSKASSRISLLQQGELGSLRG